MITDPLAILAVLLGTVVVALHLVQRYVWAERASAVIVIIFLSAVCSNTGLIPTDAPLYGSLIGFAVPFAVCVILFTVNLSDVVSAGRPMLVAFVVAALGTGLGVIAASILLDPFLTSAVGADRWKIAGPYTGTYVGGSLNFFALWTGLEIDNPDLLAAANAVDNLAIFPLYALWMWVPTVMLGKWVVAHRWRVDDSADHQGPEKEARPPLDPTHLAMLAFLAVAVMAASEWIKAVLIDPIWPSVPSILIVTTLALVLAQFDVVRRLSGAWEMGDLAFYVFFAAVGALIDFYQAVVLSPVLFVYVMVVIAVHFAFLFGVGRILRMDVAVLTIASVATKGGPPVVLPVAEAKGWRHLALPGIVIGMLGYAVGNYFGLAVAYGVRALVGGS
jgi:uncharacterized membrane protein